MDAHIELMLMRSISAACADIKAIVVNDEARNIGVSLAV